MALYRLLYAAYGPQHWWPSDTAFETIVGAILTQSTAWPNVERALVRLKSARALSPAAMVAIDSERLAEIIRPSGYYRVKSHKLKAFCCALERDFGGDLPALLALPVESLRPWLLAVYGIGPETADAIVLYAAGKPSFVVDAYTQRACTRLGMVPEDASYEGWRAFFMSRLPSEAALFNEYHALLVEHAKRSCKKRPWCETCILRESCRTATALARGPAPASVPNAVAGVDAI
jgi:endonuclease-3 related protein